MQALTDGELDLGGCGEAIKVNLGDIGYYRVEYGPAQMKAVASTFVRLAPPDRVTLFSDTFALAQAGITDRSASLDPTDPESRFFERPAAVE